MRRRKGIEQRAHPRFAHKQSITLAVGAEALRGQTRDVSLMGVFVAIENAPIAEGDEIELTVRVGSGGTHVTFVGKVVRVITNDAGMRTGIAFQLAHTPASLQMWKQHVQHVRMLGAGRA